MISMATQDPILLHLSDLHFGADKTAMDLNDRDLCLKKLLEALQSLEPEWRPSLLAITGDIAWAGKEDDYREAISWLSQLSTATGIPPEAFVLCPGNHDVIRSVAETNPRPKGIEEANAVFANGVPPYKLDSFRDYLAFCSSFGAAQLLFGGKNSGLVGAAKVGDLRFVVVNTAWFSKDDQDKDELRIGMPLIRSLERDGALLPACDFAARPLTVALLHHPQHWLHAEETAATVDPNEGSYLYLASRCHILLSGHTHEAPSAHGRAKGGAIEISCGATFKAAGHPNQFQLIRFKTDQIEYRQFVYEKKPSDFRWKAQDVRSALYSDTGTVGPRRRISPLLSIEAAQERLERHARDYSFLKSNALTPTVHPDLIPLKVERRDSAGKASLEPAERVSLEEILADGRRVLLWGDLGTGKSTAVASLVENVNQDAGKIGILITACGLLPFMPEAPQPLSIDAISSFLCHRLFQDVPPFAALRAVIDEADETVLVVDGLDEVSPKAARQIVQGLDAIPAAFPRVRVVATSRQVADVYPIGSDWLSVFMARLTSTERRAILDAAALASGLPKEDARRSAKAVSQQIAQDALLDEVATSPLALRLLYRRLAAASKHAEVSLADLLYSLLVERLEKWEGADGKTNPAPEFCQAVPSAEQRASVLSALASGMDGANSTTRIRAHGCLGAHLLLAPLPDVVTRQALEFFAWAGLVQIFDDNVEFSLRPLFEIAQAPSVLERLQKEPTAIRSVEWRSVGFAAALERTRGRVAQITDALLQYVQRYLGDPGWAVPACFVAAEARSAAVADRVISTLRPRRFTRPLYLFADQQRTTCIAIARTIALGGDQGFEWFFDEYLNPRYPWISAGSRVPEMVLEEWLSMVSPALTEKQISLLGQIPTPHIAAESHGAIRITPLAILAAPNDVSTAIQLEYLPHLLTHSTPPLIARAMERLRALTICEPELAQAAFRRHMMVGYEYGALCAKLWLESNIAKRVPAEVIDTVLRSRGGWGGEFYEQSVRDQVVARIGAAAWLRFCKWGLGSQDGRVSLGAALEVSELAPALEKLLDDRFLDSYRSGQAVKGVEEVLGSIFASEPEKYAAHLADRIANVGGRDLNSAPSAWWKLFLDSLSTQEQQGPLLLGRASAGIAPFVLARDAELRRSLRRLAESANGNAYVNELQRLLRFGTAAQRRGAALLLICMGAGLQDALLTCARASSDMLANMWEWESYCVTTKFPASVVDGILARTADLSEKARCLVLELAVSDGRTLAHDDIRFLLSEDRGNSLTDILAKGEVGFEILLGLFRAGDESRASRAAKLLLRHHRGRLADEESSCEILGFQPDLGLVTSAFVEQYRRFRKDTAHRDRVLEAGRALAARFGRSFLLPELANAASTNGAWTDVLWSLFCVSSPFPHNEELFGVFTIALSKEFPDLRDDLGLSARELCYDERLRLTSFPNPRPRLWLALLAHECGRLTDIEAASVLRESRMELRYNSAATALIARVGLPLPISGATSIVCPEPSFAHTSIEEIAAAVRDGAPLHPGAGALLYAALYDEREDIELIRLSDAGRRARVLSGILAFIYDEEPRPEWALKALDDEVWHGMDEGEFRLQLQELARLAMRSAISHDPVGAEQYVRTLMHGGIWEAINGARILGMLRRPLVGADFALVLRAYVQCPYVAQREFLMSIVENLPPRIDTEMLGEVEESLEVLATHEGGDLDPLAYVALPLILWKGGVLRSVTGSMVFRRGVLAVLNCGTLPGPVEQLAKLSGLLLAAPKQQIREAITLRTDDPRSATLALIVAAIDRE